jgi:ADP-heptose:LPS heptosyltransferase
MNINKPVKRILVIKLGAMGDIVQATGPFAAIRSHHLNSHITLLTTKKYFDFAKSGKWFDDIWIDERPTWFNLQGWVKLVKRLHNYNFYRVYDLQTSDRTAIIFYLFCFGKKPEWSGSVFGCSHRHNNPNRNLMHTIERQAEQLAIADIHNVPTPSFDGIEESSTNFGLSKPYVLLVPGGSDHRLDKRWPTKNYAQLASRLVSKNILPVVIGHKPETKLARYISLICPESKDLTNKTSMIDIIALARQAAGAVGNDTGPMHVISTSGTPSLVIYSHASDPQMCGQRGNNVSIIRQQSLENLSVNEVEASLQLR